MSVDGLLTFVGLVVALLALATDARRRALMLRLGVTVTLTLLFGVAILYLELFDVWALSCPWADGLCRVLILDGQDPWITPPQAAFVLVLVWLALILLNLRRRSLSPRHLPRLLALVTALAEENRLSELCRLTQPHLGLLAGVSAGDIGATEAQKDAATTLQRLLYRRPALVRYIAFERPTMATRMMAINHQIVFDFADQVLTLLIAHSDSPLFTEVSDNQTVTDRGYVFPNHNTYLNFLFGDAEQANRLGAWRPVLEHTLTQLGDARGQPYQSFLNGPADRFDELKWRDPTFVAIRFLDLMVEAALRQGVEWHMWLFYTPHLTARLLDLYDDPRRDQEVFEEWPTRNAYLLYAVFDALIGWIAAVESLPAVSPHLVLKSTEAVHENGNIPKSAALALGDCLRQVLMSDAVSDRFKNNLADKVFRCIANLPGEGDRGGFRQSLMASVLAGGPMMKTDHLPRLHEAFDEMDHVVRERLEDVRAALHEALRIWPEPGLAPD